MDNCVTTWSFYSSIYLDEDTLEMDNNLVYLSIYLDEDTLEMVNNLVFLFIYLYIYLDEDIPEMDNHNNNLVYLSVLSVHLSRRGYPWDGQLQEQLGLSIYLSI